MRSRIVAVLASATVIGTVISIILVSLVPLPDFPPLRPGTYSTSIASFG
ncbi:MAG TPA: hypothetical protein VF148_12800 [Acidimicrobiia bacterium]